MRGRKPTPTHLKLVTGNPGKRPLNDREARPNPHLPNPPQHLDDAAKVEWGRVTEELYRQGLLTKIDRATLAAYCQAYGRWQAAEETIAEVAKLDPMTRGLIVRTSNGNAIQNPLVGIANKAMADMVRYAVEFGMTPSARSRIQTEKPEAGVDPAAEFLG